MDRITQKRVARHTRSINARHDRFISAYIKRKKPEVYAEVKPLYDELDKKYPTKRDLTKTDEFLCQTTGYTSFYQMYRSKYESSQKPEPNNKKIKDISLKIPLMEKGDVDIAIMAEKVDESLRIPEDVYNNLLTEITNDPVMNSIFNSVNIEQEQQQQEQQQQEMGELLQEQQQQEQQQQEMGELLQEQQQQEQQQQEMGELLQEQQQQEQQQQEMGELLQEQQQQEMRELLQELDDILPQLNE